MKDESQAAVSLADLAQVVKNALAPDRAMLARELASRRR